MKIAVIGYSGSGKSTLAGELGRFYNCGVLHLDRVKFAPGWHERTDSEMTADTKSFMEKNSWIIYGNYSDILYRERLEQADQIIFLDFNRFSCLKRAYKRYRSYKNRTRPDMADGCNEKFDREFFIWIIWKSRSKKIKKRYKNVVKNFRQKTVVIKNQRGLDRFLKNIKNG